MTDTVRRAVKVEDWDITVQLRRGRWKAWAKSHWDSEDTIYDYPTLPEALKALADMIGLPPHLLTEAFGI